MRWLICLWLLAAVHVQCRHLSGSHQHHHHRSLNKARRASRTTGTTAGTTIVLAEPIKHQQQQPTTVESDDIADWTQVVLKLEVHLSPSSKQPMWKKNRKSAISTTSGIVSNNSSTTATSEGGFIHLFLPLSPVVSGPEVVSPSTTTTTTTSTTMTPPRRQHHKKTTTTAKKTKKKKKKKNRTKIDMAPIDQSSSIRKPTGGGGEQHLTMNNRLDALAAEDAGIPPLFNSLSTDETQQWARWLRCTLCLKQEQKNKESSALCQSVECQTGNVTENELTASGCQDRDVCSQWQQCENANDIPSQFAALPPCPCLYPTGLVYNDRVWDPLNRHYYRWREISLQSERVDIYRPGAAYCIRSLSVVSSMALSAQQCCYDDRRRLLTRGWAAGTPALVSHEASPHLSRVTERLPWLACKGDFSRFHLQRPPDNRLNCTVNPSDQEYQRQVLLATNY